MQLFLIKIEIFKFMPKKYSKIKDLQFYRIPKIRRQFSLKNLRIFLFLKILSIAKIVIQVLGLITHPLVTSVQR
jgi:hypothetical protein